MAMRSCLTQAVPRLVMIVKKDRDSDVADSADWDSPAIFESWNLLYPVDGDQAGAVL
jgi:hypothetical protein